MHPSSPSSAVTARTSVSLVIPVFNEAEAIPGFIERVRQVFGPHPEIRCQLVFVNDGSEDETLPVLLGCQQRDSRITIVDLSRNFGKEAALTAGLRHACGDAIVPIDVDLQDPPEVILEMLEKWREGYEVVLGRRIDRSSDPWAKRVSANWFYKVHNRIARPKIPENVGDFRLMDRKVVEAMHSLGESNRFMKGLFAWAGFRATYVDYSRPERAAGRTKFSGWKLWNFALEGVTSFSTSPLRLWTYVGLAVSLLSFAFGAFIVLQVLIYGIDAPGYASLMVVLTFLGGLQLIGIGVLGEYLGRTYIEAKRRPVYLVRQVYSPPGE